MATRSGAAMDAQRHQNHTAGTLPKSRDAGRHGNDWNRAKGLV